jgi:hypothetical protein
VTRTVLLAALLLAPAAAQAQSWRTVEVSRQLRDTSEHHVRVRYGAGTMTVVPAEQAVLFSMALRYDEERSDPVHDYDPETRALTLGLTNMNVANVGFGRRSRREGREGGDLRVALSPSVPLDLELDLSAGRGDVELGGMSIRNLRIQSNAAETTVRFSRRNLDRIRTLDIEASAGMVKVERAANGNASVIGVRGRVGSVELDLTGEWTQSVTIDADLAVGSLRIRVPWDVGVSVQGRRVLTRLDHGGTLVERDGAMVSENLDEAEHQMSVRVNSSLGSVKVERVR